MEERIIKIVKKYLINQGMFYTSKSIYEASTDLDKIIENFNNPTAIFEGVGCKEFLEYKNFYEFLVYNIQCIIDSDSLEFLEYIFSKNVMFQNSVVINNKSKFNNFYYTKDGKLVIL